MACLLMQERMSLKHKGTSRFMQKQTRYGKFNLQVCSL